MKIAVFMGGSSPEREVSLNSGKAVFEALGKKGHDVAAYDVEWSGKSTLFSALNTIVKNGTDVIFLALHGGLGENGGVQGIIEAYGIPYTGSGITGSAIAMDKDVSKKLFVYNEIETAEWICGTTETLNEGEIEDEIGFPCIVKPSDGGSTIGLSLVSTPEEIGPALKTASSFADKIMVEKFIPGCELTVPVIGGEPMPVIEIRPSHKLYDYTCKYTSGMTQYLVPAPITKELESEVQLIAVDVFNVLGLRDIARIDFRLDSDGAPLCFEANTLPGMTGTSLVPKSAAAAGMDFPELTEKISRMAYERRRNS